MLSGLFKRSGIYFIGLTLSKILSVIVFILFARTLLPQNFGNFILFVTLLQVITFFADFGLNQWYQKKADSIDKNILFNQIISARVFTLIISLIVSWIFINLTNSFSPLVTIIFLATLIPEAFLSVCDGYYLEKGNTSKVSLKTGLRMFFLFLGYVLFSSVFSFELAAKLYLLSSFVTLFWYFPWKKLSISSIFGLSKVLNTLKASSSYALLIFSSFLYARGDSLVIRYVINSTAIGIYGAAYRYLESLSLIPTALAHNLFPISAKKEGVSLDHLKKILLVSFLAAIIVSATTYIFADVLIITLIGQEYSQAIPVLKIFSAVLFLFFINSPLSTVVQSSKLINKFLPWGIGNTVFNILLNLMLVGHFGIVAAAWIMLTTEVTGLMINLYFVKKLYRHE